MIITKEKICDFEFSSRREWLVTNGIGGYAASSIINLNTRKYHGLLVASMSESGRNVVLSKLNESLVINDKPYTITTNQCTGFTEEGYKYQESFRRSLLPEFTYKINDVIVNKKIAMKYGENKVVVLYTIMPGNNDVFFRIQPLVNFRDFHSTRNCYSLDYSVRENAVNVRLNSHWDMLHMKTSDGEFEKYDRTFYKNMYYFLEDERGLEAYEDHFMPGAFVVKVPKNSEYEFEFVATVDNDKNFLSITDATSVIRAENVRYEKICKIADANTLVEKNLAISADNFVVKRGARKTIIAGYPWFGDWGRDTFIAFEGILLKTNRYKEAKEVILSFIDYINKGLIPNLIDENGGSAYNTVDASLWYIDAIYKYYKYTNDIDLIQKVFPKMNEIIESYKTGTEYGIKMDPEDCLITAGSPETQLTWMDAKVGDYIPTSRYGKAVEINALWYNALKIMEEISNDVGETFDGCISQKVRESFGKFSTDEGLLDTVDPVRNDIRPNQIFAVGLEYSPLDEEKALDVIDVVTERLYTKKGLKTLDSNNVEYISHYEGGVYNRDSAYHQGTIWPWLLHFYYNAVRKYKDSSITHVEHIEKMLLDDCIGSICEIYDAEEPRKARGAFAQAWSVAMAFIEAKNEKY